MTVTDIIVLAAFSFYFHSGWRKGFLRSLLGPIALVLCIFLSCLYFQKTHNMMISLAISFAGPIAINFLGSMILSLGQKADNKETGPSLGSRLIGVLISVSWGSVMIILIILLFSIIPPQLFGLQKAKSDVLRSSTFSLLSGIFKNTFPSLGMVQQFENPLPSGASQTIPIQETREYKELMEDKRVQALLTDEETHRQLIEKDFAKLLNNEKIFAIMQDRDLMIKFLELHKKVGGQLPVITSQP